MQRANSALLLLIVIGLVVQTGASCAADPQVNPIASETSTAEPAAEPEPTAAADEVVEIAPERWSALKAEIRGKFPNVAQLSVDELKSLLSVETERPLLLDVREAGEFEVSHLEGARLVIDEASALEALGDAPLDHKVVLYCSVGYRSSSLAKKLEARGYTNVFNLEGSIFEWVNRGERVVSETESVKLVHPYDSNWGLLLRRDYWSPLSESE